MENEHEGNKDCEGVAHARDPASKGNQAGLERLRGEKVEAEICEGDNNGEDNIRQKHLRGGDHRLPYPAQQSRFTMCVHVA